MPTFNDDNYSEDLLPKRLVSFDLDGTIIPSTSVKGRRVAIAISTYDRLMSFSRKYFGVTRFPELDQEQCSLWYREYNGPEGLIKRILSDMDLSDEVVNCLSYYFVGLFNYRLTEYNKKDLEYDSVPKCHIDFLFALDDIATVILVSYRYQTQYDFLQSLEEIGLTKDGLFGPENAFAVGGPGSSADGSKSRFVGSMWRREIRAQRRLFTDRDKSFPPFTIGDSIRDIHFSADVGGVFLGVSETGENNADSLNREIRKLGDNLHADSRIFPSLADQTIQQYLLDECKAYIETISLLKGI